jgi:hypothetical protein
VPVTVPAHQILVLPLLGRGLPGSALVVGTILPDLAFPVGGFTLNVWSHTWLAPPVMAVFGLLLFAWAEWLLLPALAHVLPREGAWPFARLVARRVLPSTARGWLVAYACVTLGAYSHLLLDGFTHAWMWPANLLYRHSGLAKLLQDVGSVVLSAVVFWWMVRHMRRLGRPEDEVGGRGLLILVGATLAGAAVGWLLGAAVLGWPANPREVIVLVFSPALLGAFAGASLGAARIIRGSRR